MRRVLPLLWTGFGASMATGFLSNASESKGGFFATSCLMFVLALATELCSGV